jgi:Ca2+-binding RTX toxin-like protein
MRSTSVGILVATALGASLFAGAGSAEAQAEDASCSFDEGSAALEVIGTGHVIGVSTGIGPLSDPDEIVVINTIPGRPPRSTVLDCRATGSLSEPTVHNVDSVSVGGAFQLTLGSLQPGATAAGEAGAPEIEVEFRATGEDTAVEVMRPGSIRGGSIDGRSGVNFNPLQESDPGAADVDLVHDADALFIVGTDADDVVDGMGGPEFTGPYSGILNFAALGGDDALLAPAGVGRMDAGAGDDLLIGGPGEDFIWERSGADRFIGHGGDDEVIAGVGDDVVNAGAGEDRLVHTDGPGPVRTDLAVNGPQHTGTVGTDVYRGFEDVQGSFGDDVFAGNGRDNTFDTFPGSDVVRGRGGDDVIEASLGDDRLFGGAGDDLLLGEGDRDVLNGGGGSDLFSGGEDLDVLLARDGTADRKLGCGPPSRHEKVRRDRRDPDPRNC